MTDTSYVMQPCTFYIRQAEFAGMKVLHVNVHRDDKAEHLDDPSYPTHQAFGRYELPARGVDVVHINENPSPNFILKAINKAEVFGDYSKQSNAWKNSAEADCVYSVHQYHLLTLAVLKKIGLFKLPIATTLYRSYGNGFLHRMFVKYFLSNFDLVLPLLPSIEDAMLENYPELADKLSVCRWGLDYDAFDRIEVTAPTDQSYYLTSGKTYRVYDPVIAAFAELDAPLRIFVGSLNTSLKRRQADHSTPDNVQFVKLRYTPQSLKEILLPARAVLIPVDPAKLNAYANGFGLTSMLDAFAVGRPIIMSDGRYAYKGIEDAGAGILVDANDPNAWRRAIEFLEENPDKAQHMGEVAREWGRSMFSINSFADCLADHLKTLARAK